MATNAPKTIDRINKGVLQEDLWRFLPGSQKSGRNNEVAVRRGSTVTNFVISMLCVLASAWFPITSKVHDILPEFSLPIDSRINYRYLLT